MRKMLFLMIMGFFMFTGVGCCPLTKLNVSIQLDKSFQDKFGANRQILVDVVGVKDAENARWTTYSMTKYWQDGDGQRKTPMSKPLTFNSKSLDPQVITSSDPMWDQWLAGASDKHPPQIFVLVQLPGFFDAAKDDKPGSEDARRQIISTSSCQNKKSGAMSGPPTIHLVILADRISMQ